jgi:hypothetical protein
MSQQNYIQNIIVPSIDLINGDAAGNANQAGNLLANQLFYFSGFLFYVEGWSWDNINNGSNIQYEGVKSDLNNMISSFAGNPFQAIRDIKNNSSPILSNVQSFDAGDSYRFPELYTVAATCRRFQVNNIWRPKYTDIISPEFFESYSQDIPSKTPLQEGELTWSLWAGDIQSYTNLPGGKLGIGSFIFTKDLSIQKYTPTSIQNSSKDLKVDKGFGEIAGNNITNYYNPAEAYIDELSTLKDGWYGVVSLDSTPYTLEAGRGINFDTFIKIKSNRVVSFHDDYPQGNISAYGRRRRQYIDG